MEQPQVSIIIPVYNAGKYLSECLDSILAQTCQDYELMLVDDCSTDDSLLLCKQYAACYSRIHLLQHAHNQGAAVARNTGMDQAQGDYLAFIDADDCIEPEYLERLLQAAEQTKADVVVEGCKLWKEDADGQRGEAENHPVIDQLTILPTDKDYRFNQLFEYRIPTVPWGRIFRREFLQDYGIRYRPAPFFDDCMFNFPALYFASTYVLIPETHYGYRFTPESVTRGDEINKVERFVDAILLNLQYINDWAVRMPELVQKPYLKTMVQLYFFNVSFHQQLQPLFQQYPMEVVNSRLYPALQKYFGENTDYILLMIDKCMTQAQNIGAMGAQSRE